MWYGIGAMTHILADALRDSCHGVRKQSSATVWHLHLLYSILFHDIVTLPTLGSMLASFLKPQYSHC